MLLTPSKADALLQVDKLGMVGTNGKKFPDIRNHLHDKIAKVYADMDVS
jgi:D-galacturonate reductase